jgi:N-acylglucosamine-6-phosphate 2-epimerase
MTNALTSLAAFRQLAPLDAKMRRGLVVSCQPVDAGPMDRDDIVVAFAQAAIAGGADALRIEGARRVAAVRAAIKSAAPIIGIIKMDLTDSPVRITPFVRDVQALADAGADVIAVDGTDRPRPATREILLAAVRQHGALAMADCSNDEDALACHSMGFDVIGTTLSGYTGDLVKNPTPSKPDYALLQRLAGQCPRVMAEGRFNTPADVQRAISVGAWAVTVGTAITRTEIVTQWFKQSTRT